MRKIVWILLAIIAALLVVPVFAQQQPINIGTSANDHTGDPLRTAFQKVNANDAELYANVVASVTAGGTDTYTATPDPSIGSLIHGKKLIVTFTNNNTGASTFNPNGLGALALKKFSSGALVDLEPNDIGDGQQYLLVYDGTNSCWQINIGGGGGSSLTAGNGTYLSGDSIHLGGTLDRHTELVLNNSTSGDSSFIVKVLSTYYSQPRLSTFKISNTGSRFTHSYTVPDDETEAPVSYTGNYFFNSNSFSMGFSRDIDGNAIAFNANLNNGFSWYYAHNQNLYYDYAMTLSPTGLNLFSNFLAEPNILTMDYSGINVKVGMIKLPGYDFGSFPTAASSTRGLIWDNDFLVPRYSNGTEWKLFAPGVGSGLTTDGSGNYIWGGTTYDNTFIDFTDAYDLNFQNLLNFNLDGSAITFDFADFTLGSASSSDLLKIINVSNATNNASLSVIAGGAIGLSANGGNIVLNGSSTDIHNSLKLLDTPSNDDALTDFLVRDPISKVIKYRTAASLGGGGGYTDEQAQDAIGAMVDASLTYVDATPLLQRAALTGDVTASAGSNTTAIAAGVIVNADINASAAIDATKIADGSITSTEFQYINTLSSNAQSQIDLKAPLASPTFTGTPVLPSTFTIGANSFIRSGAHNLTFTTSGTTGLTLPTSGTVYSSGTTDVSVADGGTGRSTGTTAYSLIATGTTATGAQQTLANGATTQILVGGGASALPVWTTATGTGAPVRGGSPTLTGTPVLPSTFTMGANSFIRSGAHNLTVTTTGTTGVTFPTTGTLSTLAGTETLTGKTIDGSSNTITNISAATGLTGNLPVARLNSGTSASATTFWAGDATWKAPFTLTTTGTSGAATFSAGTLNIPQYSGGGGGITNGAANTELMKSDGTNAVSGKIFRTTNNNTTFGDTGISGDQTLTVSSSSTDANMVIAPKGAGKLFIDNTSSTTLNFEGSAGQIYNAGYIKGVDNATMTITSGNSTVTNTAAPDLNITTGGPDGTGRYGTVQLNNNGTFSLPPPSDQSGTSFSVQTWTSTYTFSGSTASTWTLPTLSTLANGTTYLIKNIGSVNLTVQRGSTDQIHTTSLVNSFIVKPGESCALYKADYGTDIWVELFHTIVAPKVYSVAVSDEVTALTTGTSKITFVMPYAMTITSIRANLTVAQASGSIITIDINEAGSTILSTKLTIDNTETSNQAAATPYVLSDSSLADWARITIDIDGVDAATAAKGLKIDFIGY